MEEGEEDEDEEQQQRTRQVPASDAMVRRLELQAGVERATLEFSSSCRRSKVDHEWLQELTYMGAKSYASSCGQGLSKLRQVSE